MKTGKQALSSTGVNQTPRPTGFWSRKLARLPMSWGRLHLVLNEYDERRYSIYNCVVMSWDGETRVQLGAARHRDGRLIRFAGEKAVVEALRERFDESQWRLRVVTICWSMRPSFDEHLQQQGDEWRFTRWAPTLSTQPIPYGDGCLHCPYHEHRSDKPEMESGYCRYLEEGDWMTPGIGMLWDGLKACDVKLERIDTSPASRSAATARLRQV